MAVVSRSRKRSHRRAKSPLQFGNETLPHEISIIFMRADLRQLRPLKAEVQYYSAEVAPSCGTQKYFLPKRAIQCNTPTPLSQHASGVSIKRGPFFRWLRERGIIPPRKVDGLDSTLFYNSSSALAHIIYMNICLTLIQSNLTSKTGFA